MIVLSVLYPSGEGARFDHDYYMGHHIPLVRAAMTDTGLADVQVFRGQPGPDGSPPPFVAMAHLHFPDAAAMAASFGAPRAGEGSADIANFTDIRPSMQVSTLG